MDLFANLRKRASEKDLIDVKSSTDVDGLVAVIARTDDRKPAHLQRTGSSN